MAKKKITKSSEPKASAKKTKESKPSQSEAPAQKVKAVKPEVEEAPLAALKFKMTNSKLPSVHCVNKIKEVVQYPHIYI